jgi:hypothetical protein
LLAALLGSPVVEWIIQRQIQNQGAVFMPLILATTLAETASAITRQILTPVAIEGFILAFLGLVMVVIGVLLRKKAKDQIQRRLETPNG